MLVKLPNSIFHSSEWFWVMYKHMTKIMGAFLELLIVNTPGGILLGIRFSHPVRTRDFICVSSIALCYTWHDKCWTWNIMRIRSTTLFEYLWVVHKFQDIECSTVRCQVQVHFGWCFEHRKCESGSGRLCVVGLSWCIVLAKLHLSVSCCRTIQPMILDQNYIALKTQVIKAERRVLKELGFCVHVKHPHKVCNFDQLNWFFQSFIWSCILIGQYFVMRSLVRFSCVFVHCYWWLYSSCWFDVTIISFQNILLKKKFVIEYSIDTIKSPQLFSVLCIQWK